MLTAGARPGVNQNRPRAVTLFFNTNDLIRSVPFFQPKTNLPFIIAKWPGNEQKKV